MKSPSENVGSIEMTQNLFGFVAKRVRSSRAGVGVFLKWSLGLDNARKASIDRVRESASR